LIDELDALATLATEHTMTRAANRLRISQSAVSKRIAALTDRVGAPLIERDGRRVRLTATGAALVARSRPLVAELREAIAAPAAESGGRILVAVSESVLASWGPRVLARASEKTPGIALQWAAHRSLVAIERVRAGEVQLALCAGSLSGTTDLSQEPLASEAMVLVPCAGTSLRVRRNRPIDLITIESGSASWQAIRPQLTRLRRDGYDFRVGRTVQSFAPVVQLARAGFGHGLAPLGIARALGAPHRALPGGGMTRPISIFARSRTLARAAVSRWVDALARAVGQDRLGTR